MEFWIYVKYNLAMPYWILKTQCLNIVQIVQGLKVVQIISLYFVLLFVVSYSTIST